MSAGVGMWFLNEPGYFRLRAAARGFLRRQAAKGNRQALAVLRDADMFEAFLDYGIAEQLQSVGGPLSEIFAKLIQDFIDNPEKWIAIIETIIALFS